MTPIHRRCSVVSAGFTLAEKEIIMPEDTEVCELTDIEIDEVAGGQIQQVNGGGNIPSGSANGVDAVNPTGFAPPGQN